MRNNTMENKGLPLQQVAIAFVIVSSVLFLPAHVGEATSTGAPMPEMGASAECVSGMCDAPGNDVITGEDAVIDASECPRGVVRAASSVEKKRKLVVMANGQKHAYDLPGNGRSITAPLTYGNGEYEFDIMQNTQGDQYVSILELTREIKLNQEMTPFLVPNEFCKYGSSSRCARIARVIARQSDNQGEFTGRVCDFVMGALSYDRDKASLLQGGTGYVPHPDEALDAGKGICLDYASLCVAMFRSVGIPARIVCGTTSLSDDTHAWAEVWVDGAWSAHGMSTSPGRWSRLDLTFADQDAIGQAGNPVEYVDQYVY